MNRRFVWLYIPIACFALWFMLNGCSLVPGREEPVDAHTEMAKIANMIFAGASSGDSTEIMEYMEEEEGGKVLKDLLIEDGISPEEIVPKCVYYLDMPDFGSGEFQDGDILLNRDWNRFASNLLDWLIPSLYTHTGVLDQKKFFRWVKNHPRRDPEDAPCVMSAVMEEGKVALTYQTWREWASTSVVTRMRVAEKYSGDLNAHLADGKKAFKEFYKPNDSIYGFVAPYYNPKIEKYVLLPVPNDPEWIPYEEEPLYWYNFFGGSLEHPQDTFQDIGSRYWHCSKTAWWIYYKSGFTKGFYNSDGYPDVENNAWYFRQGVDVKTFGFYKLYTALLVLEEKSLEEAKLIAEPSIKGAIRMVAVPDEIRFATTNWSKELFPEAGPLDKKKRKTWGPWGQHSEMLLRLF